MIAQFRNQQKLVYLIVTVHSWDHRLDVLLPDMFTIVRQFRKFSIAQLALNDIGMTNFGIDICWEA